MRCDFCDLRFKICDLLRFRESDPPRNVHGRGVAANGVLLTAERALTRADGLPRRPWFRHQIYAPGFYTGYGVKTLPAVREAIEERDFTEAASQIPKVASAIEAYAAEIEKAASALEK